MTSVVIAQPGHGDKCTPVQMLTQPDPSMIVVPQGLPPSLSYLASLNEIIIHQQFDMLEVMTGCERNNKYSMCNSAEQQCMFAREDTDCLTRQMCGNLRPFTLNISDNVGTQLVQLSRPLRCVGSCMWCCCMQEMDVMSPPGVSVGSVKQIWTCMTPKYEVHDGQGSHIFTINGDCCYCACCTDVFFRVMNPQGEEVAKIIKHWSGLRECLGRVNDFRVQFPAEMNLFHKVLLIGAVFLIDFVYFERNQK